MNLLLLKEPKEDDSGPDPYIKELELCGHKATLIPVLSFTFVSLETLCQKLLQPEKYGGLIFTSPRTVEAARACLEAHSKMEEWDASVKDRWNVRLVYVVGKATAALVRSLGLLPQGEDSGTASVLSQFILENAADEPQKSPFLFPCGSIKREVLPTTLREHDLVLLMHFPVVCACSDFCGGKHGPANRDVMHVLPVASRGAPGNTDRLSDGPASGPGEKTDRLFLGEGCSSERGLLQPVGSPLLLGDGAQAVGARPEPDKAHSERWLSFRSQSPSCSSRSSKRGI
ncbi:uroporphyrinogen-III synthase isoform X2 [Brienomyrus brachyistius]|uniref:uroporphyrinogen-III synthase isoform X2 n=1 Tax=Brienomyrus brachyistius TaxID=42636 RepID=UPI0020B3D332|nr:uroporphyrinogen-III synthase isoform X2 [Brienomyrus brachyistius]